MTIGHEHILAVKLLVRVLTVVEQMGFHVSSQQPIELPPDGAPEPDGAIVRGVAEDYRDRYPGAADTPCVIEVADSSLPLDRGSKKRIYAEGGVEQYVIVNLVDRQVEVYEEPAPQQGTYNRESFLRGPDVVRFSLGAGRPTVDIEARRLLP